MKPSFLLLLTILLTIGAQAQVREKKPEQRSVSGRILVKIAPTATDPATMFAPLVERFGVTNIESWLNPKLISRPTVDDTRNGIQPNGSGSDEKLESLRRILEIEFSAPFTSERVAAAFAEISGVEYAEAIYLPRLLYTPNDEHLDAQWYLDVIHAKEGWDLQRGDSSLVIAIVDTGLDKFHDDLRDAVWMNPGETGTGATGDKRFNGQDDDNNGLVDDWWGYDFGGSDGNTPDNNPAPGAETHGTHVAGTAGAVGNNGIGVAGVAFGCRLMAVKISDDRTDPDLPGGFEGILYAARMGAHVINCSWGGESFSRAQQDVIDAVLEAYDVLIIAAGGNDGSESNIYPASYQGVFSVAAVTPADTRAGFSNFGRAITLAAPGTSILSTVIGNQYGVDQGTSQAAPMVSAAAALVMLRYPALDATQVAEVLRATSDDIGVALGDIYSGKMGTGRLNIHRALQVGPAIASARVIAHSVVDEDGDGVAEPGERITIRADIANVLAPSAGVTATFHSLADQPVEITNPLSSLGAMASGATATTAATDFVVRLPDGLAGTDIDMEFRIAVTTEGRTNDYYLTVRIQPTYLTTAINEIAATFNSIGNIAYNGLVRSQGDGFTYGASRSLLYHGGLIVGTAPEKVSDVVRVGRLSEGTANGFQLIDPYRLALSPDATTEIGSARFDDLHRPAGQRVGVDVQLKTYERRGGTTDNIVLAIYTLTNVSGSRIENVHAGLYLDWDIGEAGEDDYVAYDAAGGFGYAANVVETTTLAGAMTLNGGSVNFRGLDNYDLDIDLTSEFTPAEKFSLISGGLHAETSPVGDVSMVIGGGPLALDPGASTQVAFALIAAPTLDSLRATAAHAREFFASVGGVTSAPSPGAPARFHASAQPNPFSRSLRFSFAADKASDVMISLTNLRGESVLRRSLGERSAGMQDVELETSALENGVYFYRIEAGEIIYSGSVVKRD